MRYFFKKREKNVRTNSLADKSLNRSLLYTFAEETKNKTKKKKQTMSTRAEVEIETKTKLTCSELTHTSQRVC